MDTKHIVARRIRVARVERGLKQSQLAELLETTQGYVTKLESGTVNVGVETIARLAEVLHKSAGYFFEPFEDADEFPKAQRGRVA